MVACGSDGKFYGTPCQLQYEACKNPEKNLTEVPYENCRKEETNKMKFKTQSTQSNQ